MSINLLEYLSPSQNTPFVISFIDIGGSINAGILLSNLWHSKKDDKGWICKTHADFYEETRLSRRELATSRQLLKNRKILAEKKEGLPAKLYYRLDKQAMGTMLESLINQEKSITQGEYHG